MQLWSTESGDECLVSRVLAGKTECLEQLVLRYQGKAYALGRSMGVPSGELDDVVQEAFLHAFRAIRQLRDPRRFGPWLLTIVRNVARRHLDAKHALSSPFLDEIEAKSAESLETKDLREYLWRKVADLPEVVREAVFLYYQDGESVREVARVLGITRSAVKMRLKRGREILRHELWRELGDCLRDMLPSAREWKRTARSTSLLLLAALPISGAIGAREASASTISSVNTVVLGGLVMTSKKIAVLLLAIGFTSLGMFIAIDPLGLQETKDHSIAEKLPGFRPVVLGHAEGPGQMTPPTVPTLITDWESGAPLYGLVLLQDKTPAPGAEVVAHHLEPGGPPQLRWDVDVVKVLADGEGRFEFPDLEPGRWAVAAELPGGPRGLVKDIAVPAMVPLRITLESGTDIEGVVTGEDEKPLQGAEVAIRSTAPDFEPRIPMSEVKTQADDEGRFRVQGLPGGTYQVAAEAPIHWRAEASIAWPRPDPIVLRLKRGTYVAGRAYLRDTSHPLREEDLEIYQNDVHGWKRSIVKTGRGGEFLSKPLHSGSYLLTFAHGGYQRVTLEAALTHGTPREDIEIVFRDGINVKGLVQNRDGVPITNVLLTWQRFGAPRGVALECRLDGEGRFEQKGLEPGKYHAFLDGFMDEELQRAEVTLDDESSQWVVLTIDVPPPLQIRVEDAKGLPAPAVGLSCNFHTERYASSRNLSTDERGRTALLALHEGQLHVNAGDRKVGTAFGAVDMAHAPSELVLRLEPWGSIVGQVLADEEGEPVAGAEIVGRGPRFMGRTLTDEGGAFDLALPAGKWDLEVSSGPHGRTRLHGILVTAQTRTDPLTITFGRELSSTIRGRVMNSDGKGIRGANISITSLSSPDSEHNAFLQTDDEGWFALILPNAAYKVSVSAERFQSTEVELVRPGASPLDIRLEPVTERRLTGRVLLDGEPIEGAQVRYHSLREDGEQASEGQMVVTGPGGVFEFQGVEARHPRLIVTAKHALFVLGRSPVINLPSYGNLEGVEVTALQGADIEIQVIAPEAQPAESAFVSLRDEGTPRLLAEEETDTAGNVRFKRVPAGEYKIEARSGRYLSARETLSWEAREEAPPIQLKLERIERE